MNTVCWKNNRIRTDKHINFEIIIIINENYL